MTARISIGDWQQAPAIAERPVFAIGDVHGRFDLFRPLCAAIDEIIGRAGEDVRITLGDYIDRGPDGIACLKHALKWSDVCLPGNHEQFLRVFLEGGPQRLEALDIWIYNGGIEVASELGVLEGSTGAGLTAERFERVLRGALGPDLLNKFVAMPNHHRIGQYLFVHGGLHPRFGLGILDQDWNRIPDDRSTETDPLWIRGAFLTHEGPHDGDVVVVHGHTPQRDPELLANRINVDTKAYRSGVLTAVELRGERLRIIQAIGARG